ncbi:hypothetical protein [Streptomyces sparsogenes]|uniref:hypothetical protein n=1 Tax=Streptomyces sparsogenes TaxID=67365 RepID=UPI0033F1782A
MTQIDLGEPTKTDAIADRIDLFRLAVALVKETEWAEQPSVPDVTRLAEYLEGMG